MVKMRRHMPQSNVGRPSFVEAEQALKMTPGQDAHLICEDNFKLLNSEASKAVQHINDNEQYSRRNNIRIHGLHNNSDKYVQTVIDFFNTKLNINHIEADDIETVHGVSLKTQSSASDGATVQSQHTKWTTVIVRFVNRRHRDEVIRHRKLCHDTEPTDTEQSTER